jgi:RNA polymerase sigma-70 factor (ECF subfamily)
MTPIMKNDNTFRKQLEDSQVELLRFACKLTANRDDANDLLQDTMLKALSNEDKFVPGTNFKAWVYTIMRNIFINDYHRELRRQTHVDGTEGQFYLNSARDVGTSSTDSAYDVKEIHHIIALLPKENKVPFVMYISGFKYREIADKLALPLGTIKSRIFSTRSRLQTELRDFHSY